MKVSRAKVGAVSSAFVLLITLLPLAGIATANHSERTLRITPQKRNNRLDTTHRAIARLSSAPDQSSPINIDFEITGANDPDGGNSPETPDLTCTITGIDDPATSKLDESRECRSPSYGGPGESVHEGVDEIRGWIDHDGADTVIEADMAEGPDETLEPGATPEPDGTDVVVTRWFQGLPRAAGLDCSPELSNLPVTGPNSSLAMDCILVDKAPRPDMPLAGWIVDGENLGGANDPDGGVEDNLADYDDLCTTNAEGRCSFKIEATDGEAGIAELCFWVDEDEDPSYHATPPWDGTECGEPADAPENDNQTDVIEVTWVDPAGPTTRNVTLSASKKAVTFNRDFALTGAVDATDADCRENVSVTLQRMSGGDWETIASVMTSANGSYDSSIEGERTATYRALLEGSSGCATSTSEATAVGVRKKVTLESSKDRVHKGRKVKLRAKVLPCDGHERDKVKLLKRVDGKFKKKAVKRTNANCKAVFKRRISKKNAFKVVSPKQSWNFLQGVSPTRMIRMK